MAAIGDGQALDLVEAAERERGRFQAGDDVPRWRNRESRRVGNYIRVYRSGADINKDDYLAMRIPSPEAGRHTVVMTEPRSWPRGEYTVHAMTEKDGRLVSLASRDFRA